MNISLLTISSMYSGYLKSFYDRNPGIKDLPYDKHNDILLNQSTEFVSSYTSGFNKLGMNAISIIANDTILQKKWAKERGLNQACSKKILFEQIKKIQPEVLCIEDFNYLDRKFLLKVRNRIKSIRLIMAFHCAPINLNIIEKIREADFVITCTPGLKIELEQIGLRTYLVYHGFDETIGERISIRNPLLSRSIIFSGSLFQSAGYHRERIELLEKILNSKIDIDLLVNMESYTKIYAKKIIHILYVILQTLGFKSPEKGISFLEYGKNSIKDYPDVLLNAKKNPVFGLEMYQILSDSKIVLNIHGDVAGNYAGNIRLFEATGVGACVLTDNKKNMNELFNPGEEVVIYESPEDCINKIHWLQKNEGIRKKIAIAGQKKTLEKHTVSHRCRQIKEIIENELKTV
jgi:spore maturation protein CgeB